MNPAASLAFLLLMMAALPVTVDVTLLQRHTLARLLVSATCVLVALGIARRLR